MSTLSRKIDFAIIMSVKNANPNGDPLNGNRPRTDYEGLGEMTDVCIKRKIRDRMVERFVSLKKKRKKKGKLFLCSLMTASAMNSKVSGPEPRRLSEKTLAEQIQ